MNIRASILSVFARPIGLLMLLCLPAALFATATTAVERHEPSTGAEGMAGAEGTFEFKPSDWAGEGNISWWIDTDGVDPGTAGCHVGMTEDGKPNGRTFGEACTDSVTLVESNPGAQELHKHVDDIGHPDLFDCNVWCTGKGKTSGICQAAVAPPCAESAMCVCN